MAYLDESSVACSAQAFVLDHGQGDAPVGPAAPAAAAARECCDACCAAAVVIPAPANRPVSFRQAPGVLARNQLRCTKAADGEQVKALEICPEQSAGDLQSR